MEKSKKPGHIGTLLIMSTAYIAVGINTQGFKAMLPVVSQEFQISSAEAGLYATFFFLSATLLAIGTGRLVDRIGPKRGLVGGTLLIAILMFLHSMAPYFGLLLFLAFITGMGFSIITPSINKGVIMMVRPSERAVSIGIAQAGGGIGGILGASLMPFLGETLGWRTALVISAVVALAMVLILSKYYKQSSPGSDGGGSSSEDDEEETEKSSFGEDLKGLLKNHLLLYVCILAMAFGFSMGNISIHYSLFLTRDLGFTPTYAGFALSTIMIGGIIGQPSMGKINDRLLKSNRRIGLSILGFMTATMFGVLSLVVYPGLIGFNGVFVISFILGLFALSVPGLVFTTIGDVVEDRLLGTATGMALVFIRFGVVTGPPLMGWIADVSGSYQWSWGVLSACVMVATLFFWIATISSKERLYGQT